MFCMKAWCCHSCAISATRTLIMDTRSIQPDPCDSRLIRLNNALQGIGDARCIRFNNALLL
ncbi:hypothetical protein T484DRAFT_1870593 [Baffinella frigidus]|nr:hypothetical protein T484DRAFT_1870593 [Cryptophyta sp. CCMP2293]